METSLTEMMVKAAGLPWDRGYCHEIDDNNQWFLLETTENGAPTGQPVANGYFRKNAVGSSPVCEWSKAKEPDRQDEMNERAFRITICLLKNAKGAAIDGQVFEDMNELLMWLRAEKGIS